MIGQDRHRVTFQDPGDPVPDGAGGYTQTWQDLTPPKGWRVRIAPATAADLERVAAGTVLTQATSLVSGRYHPGVSTKTRMLYKGRTFAITGSRTADERGIRMELAVVETKTP